MRREEIVAAARALFAEQGVTSTTFNDLARRVGITRGLVYHYFPDKSVLVDHVLEERIAEFVHDLRAWDEAREVGNIDQAVVDCIGLLRRHVPGRGHSGTNTLHPRIDDAELHMRFVDRAVDALVDTIISTTVTDYAARHQIEIDHVRETFFVLIHGLIGLVRSHPDVPDAVLGDLVRQTLRLVPNDPATPLHPPLEGE